MTQQTAVVVGGTSGIGLATARALAAREADVHVVGRDPTKLDRVAAEHPSMTPHRADATAHDEIAPVFEKVGSIDWLVVTMSGSEGAGAIADLDVAALRRAFEEKFWGHLTSIQTALPHLTETGSITLAGAISARTGIPGSAGLAAVNGAVESLVQPLATELAPIRVNAVSPGVVDTPWWSGLPADVRQEYFAQTARTLPVKRIAAPEDVAECVVLLATNPNITGTVLECDGGARLATAA